MEKDKKPVKTTFDYSKAVRGQWKVSQPPLSDTQEIRKSKEIVAMIPSQKLTLHEDITFHYLLLRVGKAFWDHEKNELIKLPKEENYKLEFQASELYKDLKWDKNNTLGELKVSFRHMIRVAYEFRKGQETIYTSVFKKLKIHDGGKVSVILNEAFIEHLVEVKRDFVKIELNQLTSFRSKYTRQIYDLVKASKSEDGFINLDIEIKHFRELLGLQKMYPLLAKLKERVITPIMEDFKKSDLKNIKLTYKAKGVTKAHTHLNFFGKWSFELNKEVDPNQTSIFDNLDKDGWGDIDL